MCPAAVLLCVLQTGADFLLTQVAFFEEGARAAAALSVTADIWLCASTAAGLSALAPLAAAGVGSCTHYSLDPGCPLAQVCLSLALAAAWPRTAECSAASACLQSHCCLGPVHRVRGWHCRLWTQVKRRRAGSHKSACCSAGCVPPHCSPSGAGWPAAAESEPGRGSHAALWASASAAGCFRRVTRAQLRCVHLPGLWAGPHLVWQPAGAPGAADGLPVHHCGAAGRRQVLPRPGAACLPALPDHSSLLCWSRVPSS